PNALIELCTMVCYTRLQHIAALFCCNVLQCAPIYGAFRFKPACCSSSSSTKKKCCCNWLSQQFAVTVSMQDVKVQEPYSVARMFGLCCSNFQTKWTKTQGCSTKIP